MKRKIKLTYQGPLDPPENKIVIESAKRLPVVFPDDDKNYIVDFCYRKGYYWNDTWIYGKPNRLMIYPHLIIKGVYRLEFPHSYKLTVRSVPFEIIEARTPDAEDSISPAGLYQAEEIEGWGDEDADNEADLLQAKIQTILDGEVESVEVSRAQEITITLSAGKIVLVSNGEYPPGYTLELQFKEENNVYQIKL